MKYFYDAYGNILYQYDSSGIGLANINPFRFKSYYYDNETKFYYLNSRYYDPLIGRFINADDISYLDPSSVNGLNLYAYCNNNPVMGYDPMGTWNRGVFRKIVTVAVVTVAFTLIGFAIGGPAGAVIGTVVGLGLGIASLSLIDTHYSRIQKGEEYLWPEEYGDWANSEEFIKGVAANCHQFSSKNYGDNIKIMTSDGKYEAIYNKITNRIVTDPRDIGTYNYYNPTTAPFMHGVVDVLPWILWGNSSNDSTWIGQRLCYLIGEK